MTVLIICLIWSTAALLFTVRVLQKASQADQNPVQINLGARENLEVKSGSEISREQTASYVRDLPIAENPPLGMNLENVTEADAFRMWRQVLTINRFEGTPTSFVFAPSGSQVPFVSISASPERPDLNFLRVVGGYAETPPTFLPPSEAKQYPVATRIRKNADITSATVNPPEGLRESKRGTSAALVKHHVGENMFKVVH